MKRDGHMVCSCRGRMRIVWKIKNKLSESNVKDKIEWEREIGLK